MDACLLVSFVVYATVNKKKVPQPYIKFMKSVGVFSRRGACMVQRRWRVLGVWQQQHLFVCKPQRKKKNRAAAMRSSRCIKE